MSENREKRNHRQAKWIKEKKERINIVFEKGTKKRIEKVAQSLGISISEFVRRAIEEKLLRQEEDND